MDAKAGISVWWRVFWWWYEMRRCCGHIVIIIINILSYRDKLRNIMSIDTKQLAKIRLASFLLHKEPWNYAADTRDISDTLHLFYSPFLNALYWLVRKYQLQRSRAFSLFPRFFFFLFFSRFLFSSLANSRMKRARYRTLACVLAT